MKTLVTYKDENPNLVKVKKATKVKKINPVKLEKKKNRKIIDKKRYFKNAQKKIKK